MALQRTLKKYLIRNELLKEYQGTGIVLGICKRIVEVQEANLGRVSVARVQKFHVMVSEYNKMTLLC
jgi:light-regulated signal transduction histidine kinase (bacteriophytochrome)